MFFENQFTTDVILCKKPGGKKTNNRGQNSGKKLFET
jgi:hypothetical protein